MVRALRLGGRAAAAARWCTCRRAAVALCVANLVAALLVARALYAPGSFAFAPKRGELKYSREQMRWVEESIRIRRAAEPVELIEAVKKLRKAFTREEKTRKGLPLELKQKVSLEILQRLHDLGEGSNTTEQQEAVEAWRVGKLKDMRSASSKNLSNFGLSSEDSRMLKRALEFNWQRILEDIGLWIPPTIYHIEHDDKPENEPEDEEIIPGPPLPPECNTELHTDYGGTAVRWGLTHHKESAADCCQACIDQAKRARPGALKCNIWVYCPSEYGCYSPDKYEHKHQECWLKQVFSVVVYVYI
uniref:Methionine aminopeptidase 1D chloroplastic/mitochondrial n=1 Tax=Zea mays TaxID=4577 RepID=A0A804QX92_MAIZE